jgi:integrase
MGELSDRQVQAWMRARKPIAGKSDGGGLTFTLSASGTASWVFRFRLHGKPKELTLGNYPDIPLKTARKLATKARAEVDQAIDVAQAKRQKTVEAKKAGTLAVLCEQFLDREIRPRYKHPDRIESLFRRDVLPVIGRIPPLDVRPADVDRVLRRISGDGRPTVANDALRLMRALFRYGKKRGILDSNPAADFEIKDAGGEESARARKLSRDEITKLFRVIRETGASFGRDNDLAVKLLLALGVRKMELLAAKWQEFDLDAGIWHLTGERTKTGKTIDIPLAPAVVEWLRELEVRACSSAYVFPARRAAKRFPHVSPDTLNVALRSLAHGLEHFAVHDFRRTMRSELSALGVPPHIAERCLNHAIRGVEGTYDRHSYFEERKHALGVWADLLQTLERGEKYKVVSINSKAAA